MKFILSSDWDEGVADLTRRLVSELRGGKRVLWLVSGGSNIPASAQVMDNISAELSANLSVMLADERYGEVGHGDSNWAQLLKAGFRAKKAQLLPVLQAGLSFEQTVSYYRQLAKKAFAAAQVVIGQFGIGEDGHIIGILPGSPAAKESKELAVGYDSSPYQRLTLTFPALRNTTAAYVFAYGDNKLPALTKLKRKKIELAQQPAQILKQLPEAYLYSDQIGEES